MAGRWPHPLPGNGRAAFEVESPTDEEIADLQLGLAHLGWTFEGYSPTTVFTATLRGSRLHRQVGRDPLHLLREVQAANQRIADSPGHRGGLHTATGPPRAVPDPIDPRSL